MSIHTIVVEVPDDASNAEERLTAAIQRLAWPRLNDFAKVVEYHHERMTSGSDGS